MGRVQQLGSVGWESGERADARFDGYLKVIATRSRDIRGLLRGGKRLFRSCDSATAENRAHADICQNLYVKRVAESRKCRMMEIAWQLRSPFRPPQTVPPTSLTGG